MYKKNNTAIVSATCVFHAYLTKTVCVTASLSHFYSVCGSTLLRYLKTMFPRPVTCLICSEFHSIRDRKGFTRTLLRYLGTPRHPDKEDYFMHESKLIMGNPANDESDKATLYLEWNSKCFQRIAISQKLRFTYVRNLFDQYAKLYCSFQKTLHHANPKIVCARFIKFIIYLTKSNLNRCTRN